MTDAFGCAGGTPLAHVAEANFIWLAGGSVEKDATESSLNQPERQDSSTAGKKIFCGDCHAPMTWHSEMCFYCGAPRDRAITEQELAEAQASPTPLLERVAELGGNAPAPRPPSATEFSFERFYRETPPPEPEQTEKRKFNYALVTLAVLLLALVILGWRERRVAKYGFDQVAEWTRARMAEYAADEHSESRHSASKSTQTNPRRRTRFAGETVVVVREPGLSRSPEVLPITVQGQPSAAQSASGTFALSPASGRHPRLIRTPISPLRFRVAPRESLAMLLYQARPVYPLAAKAAKVEGPVILRVIIGTDGNVHSVLPLSGNPLLVPSATEAVRQWRYRPRYVDGMPAEVETDVIMEFSLADDARAQVRPLPAK